MALKLMYITNRPDVARIAQDAGVDRIFVDMEYIGKAARQGGMDTVQNHHTIEDVKRIRDSISKAKLLVRCNPIHEATEEYSSSEEEINSIIEAGADIVMLPYFKTVEEVDRFIQIVNGRAIVFPLLETPEALEVLPEILQLHGIDEIHIGLNDLSLGLKRKFLFEILADGMVEDICNKIKTKHIPYGFGGIASPGKGLLPAERIIKEHYRLGSSRVILSRSFCNTDLITDNNEIKNVFQTGVSTIRKLEKECQHEAEKSVTSRYFLDNQLEVKQIVGQIVEQTRARS